MELLQMIFSKDFCDRMTDNGFKQEDCRFTLDISNNSFMMQVMKPWSGLHKVIPILGKIQDQVGGTLSNLI